MRRIPFLLFTVSLIAAAGARPASSSTLHSLIDDPFGVTRRPLVAQKQHPDFDLDDCAINSAEKAPLRAIEAVQLALCNNPATQIEYHALKAQAYALGDTYTTYTPSVSANITADRSWSYSRNGNFTESTSGSSASLQYTLFNFGQREATLEAAEHALVAASAQYRSSVQNVIATTLTLYYNLSVSRMALNAALTAEHLAQTTLDITVSRIRVGLSPEVEKVEAESGLATSRSNRIIAQSRLDQDRLALNIYMGLSPDRWTDTEPLAESVWELSGLPGNVTELISHAISRRPDIEAERRRLSATASELRATERSNLPTVSISAGHFANSVNIADSSKDHGRSAGLNISIPLPSGLSYRYNVRKAREDLRSAEARFESDIQAVTREVSAAFFAYRNAHAQLKASNQAVHAAEASRDIQVRRYATGLGTVQDVLAGDASLQAALAMQNQSRSSLLSARVELLRAVGDMSFDMAKQEISRSCHAKEGACG